jgi:hypothetical protein
MMLPPAPATERRGGAPALRSAVQQQILVQPAVQQRMPVVDKRRASRPLPKGLPPSLDTRRGTASPLGLTLEAAPSPMRRLSSGGLDRSTNGLSSSGRSSRRERPGSPPPSPPADEPPEQPQPPRTLRRSKTAAEVEMSPELKEKEEARELKEEARELDLKGKGVVRVRLHGARDLRASDDTTKDGKKDLSDPYCTLGLHETEHRGTACHKTNPSPDPDH